MRPAVQPSLVLSDCSLLKSRKCVEMGWLFHCEYVDSARSSTRRVMLRLLKASGHSSAQGGYIITYLEVLYIYESCLRPITIALVLIRAQSYQHTTPSRHWPILADRPSKRKCSPTSLKLGSCRHGTGGWRLHDAPFQKDIKGVGRLFLQISADFSSAVLHWNFQYTKIKCET